MNPYTDTGFLQFFSVFAQRLWTLLSGGATGPLASDELQIAVLSCIAISGALIGPFLILRRMTMLANALSHTILLGIAIAFIFSTSNDVSTHFPLFIFAAIVMGFITTYITEFLTTVLKLQADASTGITFTSLFALGVVLVTLFTRNSHIGAEVVMGNVDALQTNDLFWAAAIAFINIVIVVLFFKEYLLTSFDSSLAKALGFSPAFFSYLLMSQVSVTVVSGFRAVGVLMVLALLTGPALTARLMTHNLKKLIFYAVVIGIISSFFGVATARHLLSYHGFALSTAGVTVCVITLIFAAAAFYKIVYANSGYKFGVR